MPKIDVAALPWRNSTTYPAELRAIVAGRHRRALGDAGGLTQFGVNLTRIEPGSATALRHWHESEDEMVFVLEGELVLIEDEGETRLGPGDAAAFKAGVANGHHLVNRSDRDALLLEIGTRAERDRATYPDDDLAFEKDERGRRMTRRSGEPIG